jgi:hypothetical protein
VVVVEGDGGEGADLLAEEGGGVHEFDRGASRVADDAQRIADRVGRHAREEGGEEVVQRLPAGHADAQAGVDVNGVRPGEVGHEPCGVVLALGREDAVEDRGDLRRAVHGVSDTGRVRQMLRTVGSRSGRARRSGREHSGGAESRRRPGQGPCAEHRPPRGSLLIHVIHQ